VDLETLGGVAADVPQVFRDIHSGISDTVMLGTLSLDKKKVWLIDVLMVDRKSIRGKSWSGREAALGAVCARLKGEAGKRYVLAATWNRGLMAAFDRAKESGGIGLLLRVDGGQEIILCR
jgi:hypothetical protein